MTLYKIKISWRNKFGKKIFMNEEEEAETSLDAELALDERMDESFDYDIESIVSK